MENLNIKIGTINFRIKKNSMSFNDNKITEIFNLNPTGGSIFMIKDQDNYIKIMYVVLGKGRIDLEYNVSELSNTKAHMITVTRDINDSIILYIDGSEIKRQKITF
ncbi:MAG: hypothetical protein WC872_04100 [Candidatus Absconditabacterales bacterium]